jgi:hypothetical protein
MIRYGAVAQPGERRVRNAKVGSSILLGSTNKIIEQNGLQAGQSQIKKMLEQLRDEYFRIGCPDG